MRIFIDSSVFISACASSRGASALVLRYALEGKIKCFLSIDVIIETQRNITLKLDPTGKERFEFFLSKIPFKIMDLVNKKEIAKCNKVINSKDAPVLAAAIKSKSNFLLTLDKKHFLQSEIIKFAKNLRITTPGEFVNFLKSRKTN